MDNLIKHWASYPRSFPSPFQVKSIGYIPEKSSWIDTTFSTMNFSFILRGSGEYWLDSRRWKVEAPCVMIQIPEMAHRYGPSPDKATWDELYVIFAASTYREFRRMRYVDQARPVWPVHSGDWLLNQLETINTQLGRRAEQGRADWLDRAMESLILNTLLTLGQPEQSEVEQTIQKASLWVRQNMEKGINWEQLAANLGLSYVTFRRHWKLYINKPPAAYLTWIRMSAAKRLLVETGLPIARIAQSVGIEDPLYFSRLFRTNAGISPRQYREVFHKRITGKDT